MVIIDKFVITDKFKFNMKHISRLISLYIIRDKEKLFGVLLPKVCLFLTFIHGLSMNWCLCLKLLDKSILPSS